MTVTVMMYVLPMLLGQTYDLGKDKPGFMIYPENIENEAVKINRYITDSQYRMVENSEEMKDFLDVSGKLSLKIKAGLLDVSGEGRYLKDSSAKSNGLEILVKLHFETVTFTIPSSKKPNSDWADLPEQFLGTHYCRSITYGGDLVASIRISGSDRNDLEKIKGAVSAGVKTTGGGFEGDIKGRLELLKQNAQGSSSMEINYYASVPLNGVSYTVDGLIKLVDDFPSHVKSVNDGLGNPLRMELFPLASLKQGYRAYFEDRSLTDELEDLESQFDDLRNTRYQLSSWIAKLPPNIPEKTKEKIENFREKVDSIYGTYIKTIDELDVTQGASTDPLKEAFKLYRDNEYILPQKYYRKLRSLQKEIYQDVPAFRPKVGGAQYVHWGQSKCTSAETKASMYGVATASEITTDGGSSDFVCSPLNPDPAKPEDYFVADSTSKNSPKLSPIRYKGVMNRLKDMNGKHLACAHCRSDSRTAVLVKVADESCPKDWVKEYDGYLMAPGKNAKGEYICVDKDMKEPDGEVAFGSTQADAVQDLKEVTVLCGSIPCQPPYEEMKPIGCVVCTI